MPVSLKHLSEISELGKKVEVVLAKWKDNKYYQVEVNKFDAKTSKCFVRFEDNLETWMPKADLHMQLADGLSKDHYVCCVCDAAHSKSPNEMLICDLCRQGYHLNCHQPPIDREKVDLDDHDVEWLCGVCTFLEMESSDSQSHTKPAKRVSSAEKRSPQTKSATKSSRRSSKSSASSPKSVGKSSTKIKKPQPTSSLKASASSSANRRVSTKPIKFGGDVLLAQDQPLDASKKSKEASKKSLDAEAVLAEKPMDTAEQTSKQSAAEIAKPVESSTKPMEVENDNPVKVEQPTKQDVGKAPAKGEVQLVKEPVKPMQEVVVKSFVVEPVGTTLLIEPPSQEPGTYLQDEPKKSAQQQSKPVRINGEPRDTTTNQEPQLSKAKSKTTDDAKSAELPTVASADLLKEIITSKPNPKKTAGEEKTLIPQPKTTIGKIRKPTKAELKQVPSTPGAAAY